MNEINSVNSNAVRSVIPFTANPSSAQGQSKRHIADIERDGDRVELSDTGTALAELNENDNGGIRIEKVARIRSEIQNGLYDVTGKIESVIDHILDDVLS